MPVFKTRVCLLEQPCPVENLRQALECAVTHHRKLSADEICRRAEVKLATMRHFWSESQEKEIPAKTLMNIIRVTERHELMDFLIADGGLEGMLQVILRGQGSGDHELVDTLLGAQDAQGQLSNVVREARRIRRYDEDKLLRIEQSAARVETENAHVRATARRMRDQLTSRFPKVVSA